MEDNLTASFNNTAFLIYHKDIAENLQHYCTHLGTVYKVHFKKYSFMLLKLTSFKINTLAIKRRIIVPYYNDHEEQTATR